MSVRAGHLEVICGCMFSGKSEELIRRLVRADIARQRVIAVKPAIDQRYQAEAVASHAGRQWPCIPLSTSEEILEVVHENQPQVLGIEEVQFFDHDIVAAVNDIVASGVRVICAGLDLDAMERPFGPIADLICGAESVTKLSAVCVVCGEDAHRSQLLRDGRPAHYQEQPLVHVGAAESYEARCRACFILPGKPSFVKH